MKPGIKDRLNYYVGYKRKQQTRRPEAPPDDQVPGWAIIIALLILGLAVVAGRVIFAR